MGRRTPRCLLDCFVVTDSHVNSRISIHCQRRKGRGGALESASDPEELLTAMEMSITEFFFGKSCWIGYDELDELLSDRNVDRLLTRRILRHWKNLELLLSRNVTDEETTRLRQKTIDLLSELKIGTP